MEQQLGNSKLTQVLHDGVLVIFIVSSQKASDIWFCWNFAYSELIWSHQNWINEASVYKIQ